MSTNPDDIVPEDFDLDAARNQPSTTADSDRRRCPECGSVKIVQKTAKGAAAPNRKDGRFRCKATGCQAHFDEPVRDVGLDRWGGGL